MNTETQLALLAEWRDKHKQLHRELFRLGRIFNDPTGPFFRTMFEVFEAYTGSLAHLLGDKEDWLFWYWQENEMGKRAHVAGYDGDVRLIEKLEDLLWLIEQGKTKENREINVCQ